MIEGVDVVYPACDVDLFALRDPLEIIRRTAAFGCSISVSTKAEIALPIVQGLAEINSLLRTTHGASLKIGVSFSTYSRISELEPQTAAFDSRIQNLQRLNEFSIPCCVVMKPIIPGVSLSEYQQIIEATSRWTHRFLLGDLYHENGDPSTTDEGVFICQRKVTWAIGQPVWRVSHSCSHRHMIRSLIRSRGMQAFESDLDVMEDILSACRQPCYRT